MAKILLITSQHIIMQIIIVKTKNIKSEIRLTKYKQKKLRNLLNDKIFANFSFERVIL